MTNRLCIDLCSGLGGFSQAFVDAGWDVVRIDIERKFKPTIQADVQHLPLRTGLRPKILLASPPCNAFSVAGLRHYWSIDKEGIPQPNAKAKKAIRLTKRLVKEMKRLNPQYHLLENPRGMMRRVLGRPPHSIRLCDYGTTYKKPTDLWGNVPFAWLEFQRNWERAPRGEKNHGLIGVRNPALRAKMPYGLSKAILDAVEPESVS